MKWLSCLKVPKDPDVVLPKVESGYGTGSENSLKRHGSTVSLQSNTYSTASGSSFKRSSRNIREKLAEIETFKDILCRQIDSLQKYFDYCVEDANHKLPDKDNLPVVDFKGEAITFKSTTAAVIDTLTHCAELVTQREESWHKRLDKEVDRRKKAEALSHSYFMQIQKIRTVHPGPDLEEGPHSVLADDEFYDAVESGLDKMEEEQELRERLKNGPAIPESPPPVSPAIHHRLWPEIDRTVTEQVAMARMGIGECGSGWQLFAEDGEMKMYRREEEVDGLVVDPLKAVHVVKGITGHEVCHYFFNPQYRHDWETSLENMSVIENISEDTVTFMQVYKRIWPASQRDIVFWSHMRKLPNEKDRDGPDIWTVVNNSTEYPEYPANNGKCVRMSLKVCLMCQTRVNPPKDGAPLSRSDVSCKITYCSVVNPGGWAPPSVLRAVYKREYPKFLKRFTAYVINQTKNKPIMF
ncbi:ceramide transfer protein isoform X2 [Leptinotarsa decemlineata]|uniref:ceramide transfer protein isoform X2 n=1 Tax=Leptinotarsa decemlineata TaxID=7539 RepID=UPI003D306498